MIYISVILSLLLLIYIFDYKKVRKNKQLWYYLMLAVFVAIAGFRYRLGMDTVTYEYEFYRNTICFSEWNWNSVFVETDRDSGYLILTSVIKSVFGVWEVAQFIIALIVNVVIFRFFYKNTICPFVAILLYFCSLYYDLNFETLRQALSLSLFLLGYEYLMRKKFFQYFLFVLLAIAFHRIAILALFLPVFKFVKMNTYSIAILIFLFFVVEIVNVYFFDVSMMLSLLGAETNSVGDKLVSYAASQRYGRLDDHSIVNFINIFVATVFPGIVCAFIDKRSNSHILKNNEFLLFFYLLSVVMTVAVPIFYRVSQFFLPFYIVYMANAFVFIFVKRKYFSKTLVLFIVFCFFYTYFLRFFRRSEETGNRFFVRVYPYYTVFTKEKDPEREKVYNYYWF